MSKWNAFQSAHAGQGYSASQMSAMYHASSSSSDGGSSYSSGGGSSCSSGGGGGSYSSRSSSYSTPARTSPAPAPSAWNAYQKAHSGQGMSRAEMSAGYQASKSSSSQSSASAARPASATSSTSSSYSTPARTSPSAWNAYQKAHSGQGMSREEMSARYQASKSTNNQSSVPRSASASRPASAKSPTSSSSSNAWNEYQSAHAGKGLSRSELSAGYQASKTSTTASSKTTAKSSSSSSASVSWNEFQRQHAGQGLSKRQMSLLYNHQSKLSTSTSTATTGSRAKPAKPARRVNAFNEFQKQYKKDHPDEKLSAGELAKIYREKQQLHAELEPKAPDAPLRERLRQQVEEMLLDMAMMQELGISMGEPDEWKPVAHQLEQEEGNYNRQAFVEAHGDAKEYAAHELDALKECEIIDSDRLELTLEDDKRIGSGGCGAVYAAMVDKTIPVAVKVIDVVNTKSKKRFERELLAMMKASAHENVLRVLGYTVLSSDSGRQSYGIIMELMGGGDLSFALHRDESIILSEKERLQVLLHVIKAIEFIHSQGITHRDIKPHNVLLSTDFQTAKLADFGLAGFKNTTLSTQQSQTTTKESDASMVFGLTSAYAAPEVFEGKLSFRDQAWKKSDVFSFTVLLTEVLMQEQPWEFETPQFIMNSVTKHQKRPFEVEDLVVFGGKAGNVKLHSLVQDGWHQDPACRPTATEMRERLEKIIDAGKSLSASGKASATARAGASSPRGVDGV